MPILADSHTQRGRRLSSTVKPSHILPGISASRRRPRGQQLVLALALVFALALPVVTFAAIHADTTGMFGTSTVGPALADSTPTPQFPCPGGGTPCP
ncbi:MAG TPA: hypothetical protein VLJ14_04050 [Ktedonobacterales bacterium]|nr:hypothetical protein [Ktedonobacterales bacterium]